MSLDETVDDKSTRGDKRNFEKDDSLSKSFVNMKDRWKTIYERSTKHKQDRNKA